MLSVDQLIALEVAARAELEVLQKQVEEGKEEEPISPDVAIGRLSRLDAMQMHEVSKSSMRHRQKRIAEISEALERMDEGSYGVCADCGEWIAYNRLEARPELRFCAACASEE